MFFFFQDIRLCTLFKDKTIRENVKMFVCNVLLKCPKNLAKDILNDGHKEIQELFGDEDIQQLLALPEDMPIVNINMSKRLARIKTIQTSMYHFYFKFDTVHIYFIIPFFMFLCYVL